MSTTTSTVILIFAFFSKILAATGVDIQENYKELLTNSLLPSYELLEKFLLLLNDFYSLLTSFL
jgi:hypothetical protein